MTSTIPTDPRKGLSLPHLFAALVLFILLFWLSYPYYRYFVDPDAVAYLTMAKRAAEGDVWRLVNAMWSPLHPAMVTAGIHLGLDALLSAQINNALACVFVSVMTWSLFRHFRIRAAIAFPLMLTLSVFLCYALYKQLLCDLLQLGFLLAYLRVFLSPGFSRKPLLWLLAGLMMAGAGWAKVYSFYFLLLHFPLALLVAARSEGRRFPWKALTCTLAFNLLLLAPLSALMHAKYGFWALSKSGPLNASWTLVGHKSPKPEYKVLIPPPYANSPYTWEDAYVSEAALHGPFESWAMFKSQVGHSGLAALQTVIAVNQQSCLLFAVFIVAGILWWRSRHLYPVDERVLLLGVLIMPLGYQLQHVESRYVWLLLPCGMLLGARLLERMYAWFPERKALLAASWIFAGSFVAWPVYDMKTLFRQGEDIYKLAQMLTWMNVRGSFTSNDNPSRAGCLAYWMGINYYTPVSSVIRRDELLRDMRRWNVNFYLHHQNALDATHVVMLDEQGQPMQQMDGGKIGGLQVFLVNP